MDDTHEQPQITAARQASLAADCVTLAGIPLRLEIAWPFRKSSSGADFNVLHGIAWLADGGDLHAEFAANSCW